MAVIIKGVKQMRSPDGTPGSWAIVPQGDKFQLLWDDKASPFGLFDSRGEANAAMLKFYADHPPVPV